MARMQWDTKARTPSVLVTEANLADLSPFLPGTDIRDLVWIQVASTWRGEVCEATIHDRSSFEASSFQNSNEVNGHFIDPRSAVRLIQAVEGLENNALRHLSLANTHAALLASKVTTLPPNEPVPFPAKLHNEQWLLSRLEDFIDSAAFNSPLETFAAEHAHKFKPLAPNDEHPLHYQELYLRFEAVLEVALEGFLSANGSSVADLVQVVSQAKERGDALRCIDLLLASSEYAAFLELMMDYKFSMYVEGREITPDSILAIDKVSSVSPDRAAASL